MQKVFKNPARKQNPKKPKAERPEKLDKEHGEEVEAPKKKSKAADKPNNGLSQQFLHCYSPEFWLPSVIWLPSSARGRENGKTGGKTRKSF